MDSKKMCQHSSEMEQRAANAERASVKYKQVEYIEKHIGEEGCRDCRGYEDNRLCVVCG